ncbi:MerR family transcriptional regulator [Paucibacter sp. B51]|jgi:DNA-binding transcriptional MerR regulator/methylmalonyl-CoA mutase cobalamin-binding subunit|uniref:MerR family transcriptional regulator n=1 Tax=Paucibacter sp. B51 TaxID=2993315 RepID=UPI0022EBC57A|nr:cobalamin B12-binding domain-containing protein [Paucibacter sp. B51]
MAEVLGLPDRPPSAATEAASAGDAAAGLPGIAAVERDTGIAKDTLRIWERRYGFPAPLRDALGERVYPPEQVQRLRLLKRLLDAGHRPGRVVGASDEALQELLQLSKDTRSDGGAAAALGVDLDEFLQMLRRHEVLDLRRQLAQTLLRLGLGAFVREVAAPLTVRVGEAWMRGELEVFEEHCYSEALQQVLRQAIQAIPPFALGERPRVLLSTLPGEPHGLGLLMVEALLALEGCQCLSLGVQTPASELVKAAMAHETDVLALSFSGLLNAAQVQRQLRDLRAALPERVALWAGGSAAALQRKSGLPGLEHLTELDQVAPAVAAWRSGLTAS